MAWMPSLFCHQRYKARWASIFTQSQLWLLHLKVSWWIVVRYFPWTSIYTWAVSHTKLFTRIPLLAVLWPPHPEIHNQNKCHEKKWLCGGTSLDILGPFLTLTMTPRISTTTSNKYHWMVENNPFCWKVYTMRSCLNMNFILKNDFKGTFKDKRYQIIIKRYGQQKVQAWMLLYFKIFCGNTPWKSWWCWTGMYRLHRFHVAGLDNSLWC